MRWPGSGFKGRSKQFNQVSCHPDVDLLEFGLELFLELQEELPMRRRIGHIDEDADQVVTIGFSFMTPVSENRLGLARDGSEALFQFEQGVGDRFLGDGPAVNEPER
jgi:hypothetical protein